MRLARQRVSVLAACCFIQLPLEYCAVLSVAAMKQSQLLCQSHLLRSVLAASFSFEPGDNTSFMYRPGKLNTNAKKQTTDFL